jgi:hypothetical protein
MSIKDSLYIGKEGKRKQIERWLGMNNIHSYTLRPIDELPFWTIDVDGADVNLVGNKQVSLPDYIVFNEIRGGNFLCSYSEFVSMKGFPKMVGRNLDISFSKIASLEYAPDLVDKDFVVCGLSFSKEQIRKKIRVTNNVYC